MKARLFVGGLLAAVLLAGGTTAMAQTCVGNCGSSAADGDVSLSPSGDASYQYVSTAGGVAGAASLGVGGETSGSLYTTSLFNAKAGDVLNFYFNYVTSDGGGTFSDYGYSLLENAAGQNVASLFTARTEPTGNTSPGQGLPSNSATLNPSSTAILAGSGTNGGPVFSPLAESSGTCYDAGCGLTGWVDSTYKVAQDGVYQIAFGVTNVGDNAFQSALAFDGVTVNDVPITSPVSDAPEPSTWMLMFGGVGMLGAAMRISRARRREGGGSSFALA